MRKPPILVTCYGGSTARGLRCLPGSMGGRFGGAVTPRHKRKPALRPAFAGPVPPTLIPHPEILTNSNRKPYE